MVVTERKFEQRLFLSTNFRSSVEKYFRSKENCCAWKPVLIANLLRSISISQLHLPLLLLCKGSHCHVWEFSVPSDPSVSPSVVHRSDFCSVSVSEVCGINPDKQNLKWRFGILSWSLLLSAAANQMICLDFARIIIIIHHLSFQIIELILLLILIFPIKSLAPLWLVGHNVK